MKCRELQTGEELVSRGETKMKQRKYVLENENLRIGRLTGKEEVSEILVGMSVFGSGKPAFGKGCFSFSSQQR